MKYQIYGKGKHFASLAKRILATVASVVPSSFEKAKVFHCFLSTMGHSRPLFRLLFSSFLSSQYQLQFQQCKLKNWCAWDFLFFFPVAKSVCNNSFAKGFNSSAKMETLLTRAGINEVWQVEWLQKLVLVLLNICYRQSDEQCDQMRRLFFNIWPSATIQNFQIALKIAKEGFKFLPNTK